MKTTPPARVPLLWILLPFVAGIAFGRHLPDLPNGILLTAALLSGLAAWRLHRSPIGYWQAACLLCLFFAGAASIRAADDKLRLRAALPPREAALSIEALRYFNSSDDKIKGIGRIAETEQHLSDLQGAKVYFSLYVPQEIDKGSFAPGSMIQARGLLKTGYSSEASHGFHDYLRNSGVSFLLERGIALSATPQPGNWRTRFHGLLVQAKTILQLGVDPDSPHTRSHTAMLLGLKSELDDDQESLFLQSGALHLFAISGLHIGIIASCGHALLLLLRIPKTWIPLPNLALIAAFVLMTGGAPSSWRALLMIACYYLCLASRRQAASLNALVLSALLCLLLDPQQLFLAGFQLSYATVAAILLYGVPLADRLNEHWSPFGKLPRKAWSLRHTAIDKTGRFLLSGFAISLAAFLASAALSILYFNTLPLLGIVANLFLLPLAGLAIISGFLSLCLGVIGLSPLVVLFNHAAQTTLWIMHGFLELLGRLPRSHLTFETPPNGILHLLLGAFLLILLFGYSRSWRFPKPWLWGLPLGYASLCIAIASFG